MSFIYYLEKFTYRYSLAKKEMNKNEDSRKGNSKGIVNLKITCADLFLTVENLFTVRM